MTLTDLKTTVAESNIKGWYQSRTLMLNYPYINYQLSLTGIPAIYDFVLKQLRGFTEFGELPAELINAKMLFENFKLTIIQIINAGVENDYKWNNATSIIANINQKIIPSDTPEAEFLVKLHLENRKYYNAAYNFIVGSTTYLSKDDFTGYLLAYEFTNKESSKITERRAAEKKLISKVRSDLQTNLSESETQLTDYLSSAKQKVDDKSKEIDELLETKKKEYQDWFVQVSGDISSYLIRTQERIKELEDLYQEKLKLEAPATYWKARATKLREEGRNWFIGFLICIGIGVGILLLVLNMIANGTLQEIFSTTATAIKWSVALITLISFIAYAIKIISKMSFSSLHLARDAEEREQLTYVYLALKNEKGIDETERHLIMQSLFSRADTGLLKDDASPTMPGNIVDKFLAK